MKDKKTEAGKEKACLRNRVGGQAVLEGVMMKSGEEVCLAVRKEDGSIVKKNSKYSSVRKKSAFLRLPVIRGAVNFVEMMILSFSTLSASAELLGIEEDEKKNKSTVTLVMIISVILGIALAVGLFFILPAYATRGVEALSGKTISGWLKSVIEGFTKMLIFIVYLLAVSCMKDIKRTFMYHGSEHKSIFCYEKGLPLTVENVRKQRRFHPRCGTSFMFVMMFIGIVVGILIPWDWANVDSKFLSTLLRVLIKLLLLPLVCGIGYEFLMYAGSHDNLFVKICSAPGLWMQRITTKEPDDSMIEVAITALKGAMPDEFPPENENDGNAEETKENKEDDIQGA